MYVMYSQSGLGIISCCIESSVIIACTGGAGRIRSLIIVAVSSLKEYGTSVLLDFSVSRIVWSTEMFNIVSTAIHIHKGQRRALSWSQQTSPWVPVCYDSALVKILQVSHTYACTHARMNAHMDAHTHTHTKSCEMQLLLPSEPALIACAIRCIYCGLSMISCHQILHKMDKQV